MLPKAPDREKKIWDVEKSLKTDVFLCCINLGVYLERSCREEDL